MNIKTLTSIILCAVSTQVVADKEYWLGTDGDYVRDQNGYCVRTINWTPEAAIPGCEGIDPEPEAKLVAEKATPAEEVIITDQTKVDISLASGATFEHGGSTLSAEGKAEIATLVKQFDGKTVNSVVVEGHTDGSGDAAFNQQLSLQRADAVKAELVANGADADKITTVGYGESKPIADNASPEGRAENRRVEIKVDGIKQGQL